MLNKEDCDLELSRNGHFSKTESFILKSQIVHGNKYDYSHTIYYKSNAPVTITCPSHGSFTQTPNKHLSGTGCKRCAREQHEQRCYEKKQNNVKTLLNQLQNKHPTYDFFVEDDNIICGCSIHGKVVYPYVPGQRNHYPCKLCGIATRSEKLLLSNDEYILKANQIHEGTYQYTVINDTIYAKCPFHEPFPLKGNIKANHINRGSGCTACAAELKRVHSVMPTEEFIKKSKLIHGEKYYYDSVVYINTHTPVTIRCPFHGEFNQRPLNHTQGAGCPSCKRSKGEQQLEQLLQEHQITYVPQHQYNDCISTLSGKRLRFDFFLPLQNILIEIDGQQHFYPVSFGSTSRSEDEMFERVRMHDSIKNKYAQDNNILLIRIPYYDIQCLPQLVLELKELI